MSGLLHSHVLITHLTTLPPSISICLLSIGSLSPHLESQVHNPLLVEHHHVICKIPAPLRAICQGIHHHLTYEQINTMVHSSLLSKGSFIIMALQVNIAARTSGEVARKKITTAMTLVGQHLQIYRGAAPQQAAGAHQYCTPFHLRTDKHNGPFILTFNLAARSSLELARREYHSYN